MTPGVRIFLASFLVLFLEVVLIRWMPAYVRLLAYFSNFILLASFLGIGIGCLLASPATHNGVASPSPEHLGSFSVGWRPCWSSFRSSASA